MQNKSHELVFEMLTHIVMYNKENKGPMTVWKYLDIHIGWCRRVMIEMCSSFLARSVVIIIHMQYLYFCIW